MFNTKLRVKNLVAKHDTSDPYKLAKSLNIDILIVPLPMHIRGFLVRVLRRKIILINDRLAEVAQKVVICHEIGHARLHLGYGYYFHPNLTYYIPCKREREANEFAAHLLSYSHDIDSKLVVNIIRQERPDPETIHQILAEITGG